MRAARSLKQSEDFRRVRESGTRARRDGLTVFVAEAPRERGPGRVGIVVPRTVGNAVTRNRLRRRLRAAFEDTEMRKDRDVVVRAGHAAAGVPFHQLVKDLRMALSRANDGIGDG